MERHDAVPPGLSPDPGFATTRWSVVRTAGADVPEAREALETLCRQYWYPLYVFARAREADPHAAADRVQAFFADFLSRGATAAADPAAGRFRSYLLGAFRHHLGRERERENAARRGGGVAPLGLDVDAAERRFGRAAGAGETPERAYERAWCRALLDRVRGRLEAACEAEGKGALFARLAPWLDGGPPGRPQAEVARELGMSGVAVKVAVHRLRRRFGRLLREEVAHTVEDPAAVEGELQALLEVLAPA